VKEDSGPFTLEKKMSNLKEELKLLREQGVINDGTYDDFYFLISSATTPDQLSQLSQDLDELSQAKSPPRPEEIE